MGVSGPARPTISASMSCPPSLRDEMGAVGARAAEPTWGASERARCYQFAAAPLSLYLSHTHTPSTRRLAATVRRRPAVEDGAVT